LAETGQASAAADTFTQVIDLSLADRGREGVSEMFAARIHALTAAGRLDEALARSRADMETARRLHLPWSMREIAYAEARAALAAGRVKLALAAAQKSVERIPGEPGGPIHRDLRQYGIAARAALARGDRARARSQLERGLVDLEETIRNHEGGPLADI